MSNNNTSHNNIKQKKVNGSRYHDAHSDMPPAMSDVTADDDVASSNQGPQEHAYDDGIQPDVVPDDTLLEEDITEIEERTMGRFSEREADKVFGGRAGSIDEVMSENRKRIDEIHRRESYFASAFRDSSIAAANASIPPSSSSASATAPPPSMAGTASRRSTFITNQSIDGSISSIVRPDEDAPVTDASYLLDADLYDPDQMFVHINLVGRNIPPLSSTPGIRICGGWASHKDIVERVKFFNTVDNRPTHLCWPAHKFRLMASHPEHLNPDYMKQKKHAILSLYHQNRTLATERFLQKTKQPTSRSVPPSSTAQSQSTPSSSKSTRPPRIITEQTLERREERRQYSGRNAMFNKLQRKGLRDGKTSDVAYPDSCRLNSQRYAAVIFVPDYVARGRNEDPEPLFMFLRAFSTLEACSAYAERIAQPKYSEYNVDIVDMYEWLWPTQIKSKDIQEEYRHGELAQIMKRAKIEKNKVLSYTEWCQRKNVQTPTIDIPVGRATNDDLGGGVE